MLRKIISTKLRYERENKFSHEKGGKFRKISNPDEQRKFFSTVIKMNVHIERKMT
jgi:hypothetical protein